MYSLTHLLNTSPTSLYRDVAWMTWLTLLVVLIGGVVTWLDSLLPRWFIVSYGIFVIVALVGMIAVTFRLSRRMEARKQQILEEHRACWSYTYEEWRQIVQTYNARDTHVKLWLAALAVACLANYVLYFVLLGQSTALLFLPLVTFINVLFPLVTILSPVQSQDKDPQRHRAWDQGTGQVCVHPTGIYLRGPHKHNRTIAILLPVRGTLMQATVQEGAPARLQLQSQLQTRTGTRTLHVEAAIPRAHEQAAHEVCRALSS